MFSKPTKAYGWVVVSLVVLAASESTRVLLAENVCFGTKDDTPAVIEIESDVAAFSELVLVYQSGYVTCCEVNAATCNTSCASNWGCGDQTDQSLGVEGLGMAVFLDEVSPFLDPL
jgi:hypothetical protein